MHARFTSAFSALPAPLQSALQPLLDASDFRGVFSPQDVAQLQQTTGLDDDALARRTAADCRLLRGGDGV